MKRREAIQSFGLISTHALFPTILSGFIASCNTESKATPEYIPQFFTEKELEVLKEVIDIIIPATQTASASEVFTHQFIDEVFAKCLAPGQQSFIREGFAAFINEFNATTNKQQLLIDIDAEAFTYSGSYTWFIPIKQYTLIGFFTSKEGATKASNYVAVPGDYKGDIPLKASTLNYGLTSQHYYI
jgi:hypothetical protein